MPKPFLESTDIYMYTLRPIRLAITTEGPIDAEAPIVGQHWTYLRDLLTTGIPIFGDRALVTSEAQRMKAKEPKTVNLEYGHTDECHTLSEEVSQPDPRAGWQ